MRVLCLHDTNSSGPLLLHQLNTFAKKLFENHDIELAFVNSPLVLTKHTTSANNTNNQSAIEVDEPRRTWFHDNKIGLDASILNLHQIWKQQQATTNPANAFCGIIGIGQGAAIASLLPLLQVENHFEDGHEQEEGDEEECQGFNNNHHNHNMMMFEGIEFCIFINGYDVLKSNNTNDIMEVKVEVEEDCFYHEVRNLPSLHIITESPSSTSPPGSNQNNRKVQKSKQLYQNYGGIFKTDSGGTCSGSSSSSTEQTSSPTSSSVAQLHYTQASSSSSSSSLDTSVFNTMGKFLVQQKKHKKVQRRKMMKIIQEKEYHNTNNNNNKTIEAIIEKTKLELAIVQEEAQSIMASVVAENPPKALMAVITPDPSKKNNDGGILVGGWDGDKDAFRSEEFINSGGAPCPKEFTLKQKERIIKEGENIINSNH